MDTPNKQHRLLPYIATTAYYLSFIILGLTTAANGPSLPKLAEHTSSALERISLIFVFSSLGYLIGSFFGGRAFYEVGRSRYLVSESTHPLVVDIREQLLRTGKFLEQQALFI